MHMTTSTQSAAPFISPAGNPAAPCRGVTAIPPQTMGRLSQKLVELLSVKE